MSLNKPTKAQRAAITKIGGGTKKRTSSRSNDLTASQQNFCDQRKRLTDMLFDKELEELENNEWKL